MLPLLGSAFPSSGDELQQALTAGLSRLGLTPRKVTVEGEGWPKVRALQIDVSGSSFDAPPPRVKPSAALAGRLEVEQLEFKAEPLRLAGEAVRMRLEARAAVLREHAAEVVDRLLALQKAAEGKVSLEIESAALERLMHTVAKEAAKQKGAEVPELRLKLRGDGGRAAEVEAEVVGKFGFMKATLRLTGRAELDDELNLRLSKLDLKSSGMASGVATAFLRPHLEKLQREPIALAALPLGEVKLRDVRLFTGETVRFEAAFGS